MKNKPKIGYLSWVGTNYGSVLQGTALYKSIEELGYDCEIIGARSFHHHEKPDPSLKGTDPKKYDHNLMGYNFTVYMDQLLKFADELDDIPSDASLSESQLAARDRYSAFVCGSDQVWKPYTFWFTAKQYLAFANSEITVSYAPSVGWKKIPKAAASNVPQWKQWLENVKYLSSRDLPSSSLLAQVTGREVETVVDPTLLLTPEKWLKILPKPRYAPEIQDVLKSKKPYLVAYLLDWRSSDDEIVNAIAKKLKLKIVWLTGRSNTGNVQRNCAETDPSGFVNLISGASFVIADGFHGSCFAINFSRPFIFISRRASPGNDSRIEDLYQRMGLKGRIVTSINDLETTDLLIDFTATQQLLAQERAHSLGYLSRSLKAATAYKPQTDLDNMNTDSSIINANTDSGVSPVTQSSGTAIRLDFGSAGFEPKFWEASQNEDYVQYVAKRSSKPAFGHFLRIPFMKEMRGGNSYHLHGKILLTSASPKVCIHIGTMDSAHPEIIKTITDIRTGKWQELSFDFTPKSSRANCLIFGASQFTGKESFLRLSDISLRATAEKSSKKKAVKAQKPETASEAPLPSAKTEIVPRFADKTLSSDVDNCGIIALLLKQYGIRHIVLSSGTRHMHLAAFFEFNGGFVLHNVVDERSAAFFALGIAAKLREPVACCCTSGTAASNYLSAVTEAFYQHVPLICITTDRYYYLLDQREDQMIPQINLYGRMVKKFVQLPVEFDSRESVCRRMVCEAVASATSGTPGPVHINVPISNIKRYSEEAYHFASRSISRVAYADFWDREQWLAAYEEIKSLGRILIVYGQNAPIAADEKASLSSFCSSFDAVVIYDNLANLKCDHAVNAFAILGRVTQEKDSAAVKDLKPNLVITMYGNKVMPIKKFLSRFKAYRHWEINENGEFKDPFYKLARVFRCPGVEFFARMTEIHARETQKTAPLATPSSGRLLPSSGQQEHFERNDYLNAWRKYATAENVPEKYGQRYAVFNAVRNLPAGALLHISNSLTVRLFSDYEVNSGTTVFCNRGVNGIDGSASSFMGQAEISDELCLLMIGDLSFFYDMNSLWEKNIKGNVRIMLLNNGKAGMLAKHHLSAITARHSATAESWVRSVGFRYLCSHSKEEFDQALVQFLSESDTGMFFEVFC